MEEIDASEYLAFRGPPKAVVEASEADIDAAAKGGARAEGKMASGKKEKKRKAVDAPSKNGASEVCSLYSSRA